jgi:hypothetical protein
LQDAYLVRLLDELRAPLKVALRITFEIGLELASNSGTFSAGAGPTLALRAVQVFLEEAQRFILDRAVRWAVGEVRAALGALPLNNARWNASAADRTALATHLRNLPEEPFEATPNNATYWRDMVALAASVLTKLGGQTSPDDPGVEALATIYAATQLLFIAVDRVFERKRTRIGDRRGAGEHADARFHRERHRDRSRSRRPHQQDDRQAEWHGHHAGRARDIPRRGPRADAGGRDVAGTRDAGQHGGRRSAWRPRRRILDAAHEHRRVRAGRIGWRRSASHACRGDARAACVRASEDRRGALARVDGAAPGDSRPSCGRTWTRSCSRRSDFTLDVVFTRILDWSSGSTSAQTALREACSAILMRLFGRSLVVTADAVLTHLMGGLSGAFADLSQHINDPGGIAEKLLTLVPPGPVSRDDLAEILSEHFLVLSQAAKPLDPLQRARIRDLLYQLIDTAPASPDSAFTDQLMTDLGARNLVAGKDLALEFGALFAERFVDFLMAWLERVGTKVLEVVAEIVDAIVTAVAAWIEDLEGLVRELAASVDALFAEIGRLARQAEQALDAALGAAAQIATRLAATGAARTKLRNQIKTGAVDECMSVLAAAGRYDLVPGWAISQVHSALRAAVDVLLKRCDPERRARCHSRSCARGRGLPARPARHRARRRPGRGRHGPVPRSTRGCDPRCVRRLGAPPGLAYRVHRTRDDQDVPRHGRRIVRCRHRPRQRAHSAADDHRRRARSRPRDRRRRHGPPKTWRRSSPTSSTRKWISTRRKPSSGGHCGQGQADASLQETYPASIDAMIVSPAQATVVDQSVVADIHLPGVPSGYVGSDTQPQRIHVWLNSQELPIDQFAVRALVPTLRLGDVRSGFRGPLDGVSSGERAGVPGFTLHPPASAGNRCRSHARVDVAPRPHRAPRPVLRSRVAVAQRRPDPAHRASGDRPARRHAQLGSPARHATWTPPAN